MSDINHVAIIMDGNGRWGLKKFNSRKFGHKKGIKSVEKIIEASIKKNIKYLTLYTFSTENWKRPVKEINFLFKLLEKFLSKNLNLLIEKKIKLKFIGNNSVFSKNLKKILSISEKKTQSNKRLDINIALNYGSKDEIVMAIKKTLKKKQSITKSNITNNLYTKKIPEPDLLIRTGNTQRLSNFLLWQLAYTEIFFVKKLWPDFNEADYKKILKKFKNQKRNFGGV